MNIKISSVHFNADKKLLDLIEKKVQKLKHYYEEIVGAEIKLKLSNNHEQENKIIEVRLEVPGNDLYAQRECKTFEEAVDQIVEALKNQMAKHKGKQKGS
jgi:putative sigma-54 modulation protein